MFFCCFFRRFQSNCERTMEFHVMAGFLLLINLSVIATKTEELMKNSSNHFFNDTHQLKQIVSLTSKCFVIYLTICLSHSVHFYLSEINSTNACDVTPSALTLHQLLRVTFPFGPNVTSTSLAIPLYGRWSTSGPDRGNAHFLPLQEYNLGNRRKKKNKRTKRLGLTQSARQGAM